MFKFSCVHCHQRISADESVGGTEVVCPSCGQTFVAADAIADPPESASRTPPPLPPPPIPAVRRSFAKIAGFGCLGLVAVFFVLAILSSALLPTPKPSSSTAGQSSTPESTTVTEQTPKSVRILKEPRFDPSLEAKAEAGDAKAQYDFSSQLRRTKGYDKDEVRKWVKRSADNGYWEAQVEMGNHYCDAN